MINHLRDFIRIPAARAIGIIFALCGLSFGTWASFIPFIKEKFDLDEAQLGLLLLSMPLGNFIVNPWTVIFIKKWGAVRIALTGGALTIVFFAVTISMTWIPLVSLGLFLAGGFFGSTNIAMNTCASILEEKNGLKLMSAYHGMWSAGAMVGAFFSGIALIPLHHFSEWISPQSFYVFILSIFVLIIIFRIRNDLDQMKDSHLQSVENQKLNWKTFRPGKTLWILIIICLCSYLTEGTMTDWSGVYLKEINLAPVTMVGWGYAVYAFFMASGRFLGDNLIGRFGGMRVLRIGGILVFIGMFIIIFSIGLWSAFPGFMLIGMGISLASPILYGSAAKIPGLAPGVGLATLNTFAMASFLGGPVLIGFIGKAINLRIAFTLVAFTSIIWIIQTTRVIKSG